jgi:hypothetical protein
VQPVPAPAWGLRPGRAAWLAAALALLAAGIVIALLAAPDSTPAPAAAKSALQVIGGKPLQQATCQQWNAGSADERAAVLDALKATVGGPTPYGPGTTLTDAQAYALFARACTPAYARGFMLYIIYSRAAAYQYVPQRFQ